MTKFYTGDKVKYIGENIGLSHDGKTAEIFGIKCISDSTNKPIYHIVFDHETDNYAFGIHEDNLVLIKQRPPDWEV